MPCRGLETNFQLPPRKPAVSAPLSSALLSGAAAATVVAASVAATISRVSPRGPRTGVEVPGDHDPDRFDPARHVEDAPKSALREDLLGFGGHSFMARRAVLTGLLETEEIEPLVVLVAAARHGREVIPPSAGQACRAATFRGPLSAASTASARRVTAARLSGRPPAIAAAALATAAPPAAARPFLAGPLALGPIAVSVRGSCPIGGDVGTHGRVRL